jgi:hypothetical protein
MNISYLTRFFLKVDFRNREEKKHNRVIAIIISYLFANILLSGNAYFLFDKSSFVLVSFSTSMFLIFFLVLSEYENLFFEKSNFDFIKSLPLQKKDLFLSKFISATLYLIFFVFIIVIPQSIFIYYYDKNLFDIFWFLAVSFLFVISSLSFISIVYTVILLTSRKTRFFLHFLQATFIFYVLGVNSIASESIKFGRVNLLDLTPIKYTPQYFFLKAVNIKIEFWIALCITIFLSLIMYLLFVSKYFYISEILLSQHATKKSYTGLKGIFLFESIEKIILKTSDTQAGYRLAMNMFLRSKALRIRVFPTIILPILFSVVIIFTNQNNIFFDSRVLEFFETEIKVLNPSITLILLFTSRLLLKNFLYSDEGPVNIVEFYKSLPIKNGKSFWVGVMIFVIVFLLIPTYFMVSVCLSFVADITAIIANMFFVFSFIIFLNSLNLTNNKILPFSVQNTRYSSFSRLGDFLLVILIFIVFFILQIITFKNTVVFIFVIMSLFTLIGIFIRTKK